MKDYGAKDVDAYIDSSASEARATMEELRKIIRSTIPQAEEKISWGVPFYWYQGALGGFAAYKNHVSFGLAFVLDDDDRKELEEKGYKTGKKTIQIRFDQKAPAPAIKRMLKAQARINAAKRARK